MLSLLVSGYVRTIDVDDNFPKDIYDICFKFYYTSIPKIIFNFRQCALGNNAQEGGIFLFDIDSNKRWKTNIFYLNDIRFKMNSQKHATRTNYNISSCSCLVRDFIFPEKTMNKLINAYNKKNGNGTIYNQHSIAKNHVLFQCFDNKCRAIILCNQEMNKGQSRRLVAFRLDLPSIKLSNVKADKYWKLIYSRKYGLFLIAFKTRKANCYHLQLESEKNKLKSLSKAKWKLIGNKNKYFTEQGICIMIEEFDMFLIFYGTKCEKYLCKNYRLSGISNYKLLKNISYPLNAGYFYDQYSHKIYKYNKRFVRMYDVLQNKWLKGAKKTLIKHNAQSILWVNDKLLYIASSKGVEYYGLDENNSETYKKWKILFEDKAFSRAFHSTPASWDRYDMILL